MIRFKFHYKLLTEKIVWNHYSNRSEYTYSHPDGKTISLVITRQNHPEGYVHHSVSIERGKGVGNLTKPVRSEPENEEQKQKQRISRTADSAFAIKAHAAFKDYLQNHVGSNEVISGHAYDIDHHVKRQKDHLYKKIFKHIAANSRGKYTYHSDLSFPEKTAAKILDKVGGPPITGHHALIKEHFLIVNEIYKPVAKSSVDWKTERFDGHNNQSDYSTSSITPNGHKVRVDVYRTGKIHDFNFFVNNSATASFAALTEKPIEQKDKEHIRHFVTNAFNHYTQHKLPKGHSMYGRASVGDGKESLKTSLYSAGMRSYEKRNNKFKYKSEDEGKDHYLTKIAEELNEIYKPVAKDAVKWTTHSDLDHTVHIATHILPSGNKLNIAVGNYQGTREHSFGFDINSQYHKRQDLPKEDHVAIRNHVETAINHYTQHMMKKHDYLQGQAMGSNKTEQNKKDKLYKFALKSLAKKSKGKFAHEARPSIHGNADFHNLIKLSENVVSRLFRRTKNKIGNNLPNPIRQRIAAFPMLGASIRMKQDGHDKVAAKAREEGIKLLKGKGRIPPPGKRNKVDY